MSVLLVESPSLRNLREGARVRRTKEQLMELSSKNSRPQSADVSLKPADDSKIITETAEKPADRKRGKGERMRFRKVSSEKSKIRTETGSEKSRRKRDSLELRQKGRERGEWSSIPNLNSEYLEICFLKWKLLMLNRRP